MLRAGADRLANDYRAYLGEEPIPTDWDDLLADLKKFREAWEAVKARRAGAAPEGMEDLDVPELLIQISDDGGGSWENVYEGSVLWIRVNELFKAPDAWRTVYSPRDLRDFYGWLEPADKSAADEGHEGVSERDSGTRGA